MSSLLSANIAVYAAVPALVWSSVVYVVQSIGISKLLRYYSSPPRKAVAPDLPEDELPHVTIIRPVKDLEPQLYECLASTFRQVYPRSKLTISLCISSENDPAYPVLEQIAEDFAKDGFNVKLYVEEYDPLISSLDEKEGYGPNPKIRNISRAYREAPSDSLIWMLDCNVWIGPDVAGHMVDRLMGYLPGKSRAKPFKFVHQLPLVVDIPPSNEAKATGHGEGLWQRVWRLGGGRLDEMFIASTHAKFYSAINTVGVAPCVVGKSNMFRKQHLDTYTQPEFNRNLSPADADRGRGVDFFSSYICEDHLIGDLLWRADIPGHKNHGLVWGDIAIQPVSEMSVAQYWARRVRWLRVRKWTVLLATLVEPGVESLLCNLYFSYALTTLPFFNNTFAIIPQTWKAMCWLWLAGVSIWMACDRLLYRRLHSCLTVEPDGNTPFFARGAGRPGGVKTRPFKEWLPAWIGREILAMPIWTWAVLLGTTVKWRGKSFRVRSDMSVVALQEVGERPAQNGHTVDGGEGLSNGAATDEWKHRDVPSWEGRPTATHRKSRSFAQE